MVRDVNFLEAVKLAFVNYFNFRGRSHRAEYWWFTLFNFIGGIILGALDLALGMGDLSPTSNLFSLVTFIPGLAVGWRRMHDINKSGWWTLFPLIPLILVGVFIGMSFMGTGLDGSSSGVGALFAILAIIGGLATLAAFVYVIVLLATDSDRHDNRFGPSPKYGSTGDIFA